MPAGQEIAYSTTVAGNQSLEPPFIAQYLLLVACLATAWLTVNALVGAHHLSDIALLYQCLEGRQVGLPEVALWQVLNVKSMAVPFRATVYGKVLGTGQQFFVLFIDRITFVAVAL